MPGPPPPAGTSNAQWHTLIKGGRANRSNIEPLPPVATATGRFPPITIIGHPTMPGTKGNGRLLSFSSLKVRKALPIILSMGKPYPLPTKQTVVPFGPRMRKAIPGIINRAKPYPVPTKQTILPFPPRLRGVIPLLVNKGKPYPVPTYPVLLVPFPRMRRAIPGIVNMGKPYPVPTKQTYLIPPHFVFPAGVKPTLLGTLYGRQSEKPATKGNIRLTLFPLIPFVPPPAAADSGQIIYAGMIQPSSGASHGIVSMWREDRERFQRRYW